MTPVEVNSAVYVVELPGGGWRLAGTRVSLDSVIHAYREGESPEQIARIFPSLTPEQVHGAIAYYLRNQSTIDEYLVHQADRWDQLQSEAAKRNAALRERILSRGTTLPSHEPTR